MWIPFKKNDENKETKTKNFLTTTVLKLLGINPFDHQENFTQWVAEHNANLFNGTVITAYQTINNYLVTSNFYEKNWLALKVKSLSGVTAYVIFANKNRLFYQRVNISNRVYDITGKLIEATIFYQPYTKNSIEVLLYESYKLVYQGNKTQLKINRYFNEIKDNKKISKISDKKFSDYILNDKLENEQLLNIDYVPISIFKNKPDETSDCNLAMNKIATLDIFFEQIILDVVINSTKFLFGETYGNSQAQVESTVLKLVSKSYFFTTDPQAIQILQGSFKGKQLTDVVDWMINEISKRIFLYIPSQKKSAQQTKGESESVNIGTVNSVEQKILQYKVDMFNFLKLLIKFDQDILFKKTFSINAKEINWETLKLEMDIINPATNQLEGEDSARKNNIS